ncbi:MAG TPA: hypothetical protein VI479_22835, partial [Blastocatellia bacterium]
MKVTRYPLIAVIFALFAAAPVFAQADIIYTGTAQPSIESTSITGAQRGATVTMEVNGLNLGGESGALFNKPGFAAKVLAFSERLREKPRASGTAPVMMDKATLSRITLEIAVASDVEPGIYRFRLKTAMGTTNSLPFVVTPFAETPERGRSASMETAQEVSLPATITGNIGRRGEADHFKFKARAGQQIVFEAVAAAIGSRLNPVVTLFDAEGRRLAVNDDFNGQADSLLGYTFEETGQYVVSVTDAERGGMARGYEYRLNAGEFAYVTGAFPLGLRRGTTSEVALSGFNLIGARKITAPATAPADGKWMIRGSGPNGESLNQLKLDVGQYPEIIESGGNNTLASAQETMWPVTINGLIFNEKARMAILEDYYRFHAKKGQKLILEVAAQRFGSPLDSVIEVLDARGLPVPRAVLRAELATELTLNDRDSATRGLRLLNWNGMAPGDYLLVGNELLQIERMPFFPDDDTVMVNFDGVRYGFEDTTPETHAMGTPVYKVTIHPPAAKFSSNGLPVVTLYYRNDDAGPLYDPAGQKDSRLHFTAPADGEYFVRIHDVRGLSDERFAYRLSIHEPQPDFTLTIEPGNPNVQRGGSRDLRVRAFRRDGFNSEIEVRLLNLPAGFTATAGKIPAGQNSGVVILSAAPDAPDVQDSFSLRAEGVATINGQRALREAPTIQDFNIVSVAPSPELLVFTKERQVEVAPGSDIFISVSVTRREGFNGRVPFEVIGLPLGVTLRDL